MNTQTKQCRTCLTPKALNDFRNKAQNRDGKENECTLCARARGKLRFKTNEGFRLSIQEWRIRQKGLLHAHILDHFSTHPCVDCGEDDKVVLEFDHVRGTKVANISKLISDSVSLEKMAAEIAKCDVRCCNCHRRATLTRLTKTYRTKIKGIPFPA